MIGLGARHVPGNDVIILDDSASSFAFGDADTLGQGQRGGNDVILALGGDNSFIFGDARQMLDNAHGGAFGRNVVWDFTKGEDLLGFSGNPPPAGSPSTGSLTLEDLTLTQTVAGTLITVEAGTAVGSVLLAGFSGTLTQADLIA